jgi:hypothetical protein
MVWCGVVWCGVGSTHLAIQAGIKDEEEEEEERR